MSTDYNRKGRTYELFIRKVFNNKSGKGYGADESLMIQLFINEQEEKEKKSRIPYSRKLFKVKMNIEKALIKLGKRKKYLDSYENFSPLLVKLHEAETPNDLSEVVNASFKKIIELEHEMKSSA